MGLIRTRLAVGLVSMAVICLELALMRILSLRFWSHFAYMVISVALLGFGASGTAICLLRRRIAARPRGWLFALALGFSVSAPLAQLISRHVPLDVQFLAWDLRQVGYVVALELLMFVPFLLAGGFVGVALCDLPRRVSGHYAANLAGSGLGAVAAVGIMYGNPPEVLLYASAAAGLLAATAIMPPRGWAVAGLAAGAAAVALCAPWLRRPIVSPYKMLSQVQLLPGTEVIHRSEGPVGRLDVVAGPAVRYAPGLSLQWQRPVPAHVLLITDGDQVSPLYDCRRLEDWAFMDYTTAAAAYHLHPRPLACIIGAGGGADIGLALFHHSRGVVGLEMNSRIIDAMTGVLAGRGGGIYTAPGVRVVNQEARGFFAGRGGAAADRFDVIQLPPIDAFGSSGAGLYATQEAYLYTVESLAGMLDRLSDDGLLCVTRWVRVPPRDGLRVFDTAAQALRRGGRDPSRHLAMIRSMLTVTVLAFKQPISAAQAEALRAFCRARGFDVCYLPGMDAPPAEPFHQTDRPYYFEGAHALLGPGRREYLQAYLFQIAATTDDKPYFFHNFRWRQLPELNRQLGRRGRAFIEAGYLMLIASLGQAVALAALLIAGPLVPRIRAMGNARGKAPTFAYFLLLGAGFMLLEMGFLQKLILYLSHPIYSAAAVISSFLIFAGLGSQLSRSWPGRLKRLAAVAAAAVVGIASAYAFGLDRWLSLTRAAPVPVRFLVAAATIAPLALAMGQMFPTGLRMLGGGPAGLVPWAWAVNGFSSVVATVAAPLLAMEFGFRRLLLVAVACYALAGLVCRWLPEGGRCPGGVQSDKLV